jgi:hypothetical protein
MNARAKKEIDALIKKYDGAVTPKQVVDFARSDKTALHALFTWDDSEAAEKWRLHQARNVLRVTVTMLPNETIPSRVVVSLMPDRHAGVGYRSMPTVLNDKEKSEQLLKDAMQELTTFKMKYSRLKALVGVFAEIDKLQVTIERPEAKRVAM